MYKSHCQAIIKEESKWCVSAVVGHTHEETTYLMAPELWFGRERISNIGVVQRPCSCSSDVSVNETQPPRGLLKQTAGPTPPAPDAAGLGGPETLAL